MVHNDKYKFVAVINEKIETGKALNAIAHMGLGLVNIADEETKEKMSFIDFPDKDDEAHKSISGLSLIVLKGRNGEIKKVRNQFKEENIMFVDFIETMTGDTYAEQLVKTKELGQEEHNYFGILAFGEIDKINPITKKLSLWR
ncbi:MAG: DUF2000 domain-containing protein [Clostridia bacterium]|nr:DUF2000 domain-containing protein [Clostridia bacterium]MCI8832713.1 DUF2000 domain-containing protein [Clostridia bacterium]